MMYQVISTTYAKNPVTRFWESVKERTITYLSTIEEVRAFCKCDLKQERGGWNGTLYGYAEDTEFFAIPCYA